VVETKRLSPDHEGCRLLLILLLGGVLCCSCASERCSCPEPTRPKMAYAFQQAVPYCISCDACYLLYWYFDCDGKSARYLGSFDSRGPGDQPVWVSRANEIQECYPLTGYCPDRSWGYYTDPELTPRQDEEAEEASLWLSGSLVAPQELYELISQDLAMIRATWRDSIPQVDSVTFYPYLFSNYLYVKLYPDDYVELSRGEYHDWDSLNTLYGVTEVRPLRYDSVYLIFAGRYHTPRLARIYKGIPSVWITEAVEGNGAPLCEPSTVVAWRQE
jgi:hypothetical protein